MCNNKGKITFWNNRYTTRVVAVVAVVCKPKCNVKITRDSSGENITSIKINGRKTISPITNNGETTLSDLKVNGRSLKNNEYIFILGPSIFIFYKNSNKIYGSLMWIHQN